MQSRLGRSLRQEQVDHAYSYTMLFNGFALRTARKNLETIQSTKGVSRAFVAGSYTLRGAGRYAGPAGGAGHQSVHR